MTNEVAVWDPASGAALPAHIAAAMGALGTNIIDRQTTPSLSYEGKVWTVSFQGNKTKLTAENQDGDRVPVAIMRMVILNYNPERGRAFYEGDYNPAAAAAPKCWSADGKTPDASVKEKQASLCQGCPQSVKGSKLKDGREMTACSSHRMLAVVPALDLSSEPLRLKIAATSDFDKEVVEHGWFAFRQYGDWLKSRGIVHTAMVVTKVKFDDGAAFPKLLFALDRLLSADEVTRATELVTSGKVTALLTESWTPAGVNGTDKTQNDMAPWGLEGAYADGWAAHPDSAGWSWKGAEVIKNDDLAARYPQPEPAPEPPATPPAIPAAEQVVEHVATPPAHDPLAIATADGWAVHPSDPAWMFKGDQVLQPADVAALYPAKAAAPAVPPTPAAPAVPATPPHDPLAAATSDGWQVHPNDAAWMFKGDDVKSLDDVKALYSGNAGATPVTPAAGAASTNGAAGGTSTTSTTATSSASPSDGSVPADVQGLLDKWTKD